MFCGLIIKPGQKVKLDSTQGEILHLSQACLSEPKDNGRVYVQAIDNGNAYTICSLQKGTIEHANLDLFLSTSAEIELSIIGKNEVHISGFYEPEMEEDFDDDDALMGMSDEEEDEEEEEEEEEEEPELESSKIDNKKSLKRKLPSKSDESTEEEIDDEEIDSDEADDLDLDELIQDNDEDDDEDGDEDSDEDDEDDLDDLDDDEEEEEEEEEPVKAPSTKNKNKQSSTSQKTKSSDSQPPSKKSRLESKSQSKPDQLYEESIIDFLKKNGRTNMAMIGNKIKRPEGVSKKLGSFIAERTDLFKVENNMISLVK